MRMSKAQLLRDSDYELVPEDELPTPVVYRHKDTGNLVFLAPDDRGIGRVLDAFVELRDFGGGQLEYVKRTRRGIFYRLGTVFQAAGALLVFVSDPRLKMVLELTGLSAKPFIEAVDKVKNFVGKDKVLALIEVLDRRDLEELHDVISSALDDGVFTAEEWKQVQRIARNGQLKV